MTAGDVSQHTDDEIQQGVRSPFIACEVDIPYLRNAVLSAARLASDNSIGWLHELHATHSPAHVWRCVHLSIHLCVLI